MSARNAKKLQQDRKRRDARLYKATGGVRPEPPAPADVETPLFPAASPPAPHTFLTESPPPVTQPEDAPTPLDDWWDDFMTADVAQQLQMVRDKLDVITDDDSDWYDIIVNDAFIELRSDLSETAYAAFLQEVRARWPAFFAGEADWYGRSLMHFFIAERRWDEVDRVVVDAALMLTEIREPFDELLSTARLAGRDRVVQALLDAAIRIANDSDYSHGPMLSAALLPHYEACMRPDVTDDELAGLARAAIALGFDDNNRVRHEMREVALCLAGKRGEWTRDEFKNNDRAERRMNRLSASFLRWMCLSRGFTPLVADELREILVDAILAMGVPIVTIFEGVSRTDLESVLMSDLGFFSLTRNHAPAALIAIWHFYDFLAEIGLVRPPDHQSVCFICRDLLQTLRTALADEWQQQWWFLESYLPPTARLMV